MDNKNELIDEESGVKILDHEYDGIRELDNSLPPWWLYLFYGTIIFAIIYSVMFFGMGKYNQQDELNKEIEIANANIAKYKEANGPGIDENTVTLSMDTGELTDGEAIYQKNCIACHGANGGGGVGPNLTDNAWIHGSSINDVFKTIKYGVPEKGMIPWESQLNPEQIRNVSSFILSEFKNKNVEGGKAPQGEVE